MNKLLYGWQIYEEEEGKKYKREGQSHSFITLFIHTIVRYDIFSIISQIFFPHT